MSSIFVSYSRSDQDITDNLIQDISDLGHNVWLDKELSGGQKWWNKILFEIRRADIFVLILSDNSRESLACTLEYEYAYSLEKSIIPILVSGSMSDALPALLAEIQLVNYLKPEQKSCAFSLARALNDIKSFSPLPSPLPKPPKTPLSYFGNIAKKIETESILSESQQNTILLDLKKSLYDKKGINKDSLILLKSYKRRGDLYENIESEINNILSDIEKIKYKKPYIKILTTLAMVVGVFSLPLMWYVHFQWTWVTLLSFISLFFLLR